MSELILGTAALGMPYGTQKTLLPSETTELILTTAIEEDVALDTAPGYGCAEIRIGAAVQLLDAATNVGVSTKIPYIPPNTKLAVEILEESITNSKHKLQTDYLSTVYLHDQRNIEVHGEELYKALRANEFVTYAGVSIYDPEYLQPALDRGFECIQLPLNILDLRWAKFDFRAEMSTTFVARSVFLQGLLARGELTSWPYEAVRILPALRQIAWMLGRESLKDLCVAYVRGKLGIDGKCCIGVTSMHEYEELKYLFRLAPLSATECKRVEALVSEINYDPKLVDPRTWTA